MTLATTATILLDTMARGLFHLEPRLSEFLNRYRFFRRMSLRNMEIVLRMFAVIPAFFLVMMRARTVRVRVVFAATHFVFLFRGFKKYFYLKRILFNLLVKTETKYLAQYMKGMDYLLPDRSDFVKDLVASVKTEKLHSMWPDIVSILSKMCPMQFSVVMDIAKQYSLLDTNHYWTVPNIAPTAETILNLTGPFKETLIDQYKIKKTDLTEKNQKNIDDILEDIERMVKMTVPEFIRSTKLRKPEDAFNQMYNLAIWYSDYLKNFEDVDDLIEQLQIFKNFPLSQWRHAWKEANIPKKVPLPIGYSCPK